MGRTTSYEIDETYDPGPSGQQLARDLIVLAGLAFARWGQADAASRIAHTHFAGSTLATQLEPALQLSGEMARGRRVREALELATELDADPAAGESAFVFTLVSLFNQDSLSEVETELHRATLRRRIERREARGNLVEAARDYVNLGNHYRFQGAGAEAARSYEKAAECDPEYLQREHYWREYGGTLFFGDRYVEAADAYERALELGAHQFAALLRADCLMFAGRYREALEEFNREVGREGFGEDSLERAAEYVLKQYLLADLIERLGLEEQRRDPARAEMMAGRAGDLGSSEDVHDLMVEALRADGLCGLAWWNLAQAYREVDRDGVAGSLFLSTALCQPADVEAWGLATLLTWFHGDMMLVPLILITGERVTASRLLPRLGEIVAEQLVPAERQQFHQALDAILEDLADRVEAGFVVRAVNPGEETTVTEIPSATTRRSDR